ncbi:ribosome biogenesis protein BOP1-like [Uloborus diversus]|uniref:ribosome biogenesis protein BOP1-like n=1 Tax=Uloborus diversus TaxID=327109 RepID=UPI00240A3115|nr:ribosome biogenesis protein BOP1-like [Uloborus diversus]
MKTQHSISKSDQAEDSDSSVYSGLEDEDDTSLSESENEDQKILAEPCNVSNASINGESSRQVAVDEYAEDTSDEEDIRNTVGNIPMQWYDDFPHIGYDIEGKKLMKPATNDEIDEFLSKIDDPNYW